MELVSIFATKGIDAEIDLHRQRLVERGLFVREELDDHTEFIFDDPEKIAETHVFKIIDKNRTVQEYEFWLSITANGDYYYFTTLLTPTREDNFFKWSRNTQAYKEVAKNFKAQPEASAISLE